MKKITLILLILVGFAANAQKSTSISRSIDDDGKTLRVKIHAEGNRTVDYEREFESAQYSKTAREQLLDHLADSLGITRMNAPRTPVPPPTAPNEPLRSAAVATTKRRQVLVSDGKIPYTKEVVEDPEKGTLFLRYQYTKNGQEFTYDHRADVRGKTDREKQKLIEDTEKTLGLK